MNSTPSPPNHAWEIRYSAWKVILANAFFMMAAAMATWWAVLGIYSGHRLIAMFGVFAGLVIAAVLLPFVRAVVHPWRHQGPVVIFDRDGVTDVRKLHSFIPWADIGQISLGSGETHAFLCFEFRRADPEREDPPRLGPLGFLMKRLMTLSDWNVSLRLLACGRRETLAAAIRFHRQAMRADIVERNKNSTHGWSGTL